MLTSKIFKQLCKGKLLFFHEESIIKCHVIYFINFFVIGVDEIKTHQIFCTPNIRHLSSFYFQGNSKIYILSSSIQLRRIWNYFHKFGNFFWDGRHVHFRKGCWGQLFFALIVLQARCHIEITFKIQKAAVHDWYLFQKKELKIWIEFDERGFVKEIKFGGY